MTDKQPVADGSTVKLTKQSNGWKVQVLHQDGGISGRNAPFETLDEVAAHLRDTYDVR